MSTSSGKMYCEFKYSINLGYFLFVKSNGVEPSRDSLGIALILSCNLFIISVVIFSKDVPFGKTLLIYSWLTSISYFS